jgi:hypothetical protein
MGPTPNNEGMPERPSTSHDPTGENPSGSDASAPQPGDDETAPAGEYPISSEEILEDIEARERVRALLAAKNRELDELALPNREDAQFSLTWLMILSTAACVLLSIGRLLPSALFAGACGVATFVYLAILSAFKVRRAIPTAIFWLLFFVYLIASAAAVVERIRR